MNEKFLTIPGVGDLFFRQIYLFYDEPLIFSCVNSAFQYYIVESVPAGDTDARWIVAPISLARLIKLENNVVEIREVFSRPETSTLLLASCVKNKITVEIIDNPMSLSDDMLPMPGEYLDCDSVDSELLPANISTPAKIAGQEMRDVIEISLEHDDLHMHEISCDGLSDILDGTQQLIYAIAYKEGGLRGTIPKKIRSDCKLCVTGTFAASFGVRLKSDDICNLELETPLTETLMGFNYLFSISSTGDSEKLHEFFANNNPRVAVKYRSLIRTLLNHNIETYYPFYCRKVQKNQREQR